MFIFLILIMSAVSCFLFYEYRFFKKQSEHLLELQEDYRTYIGAVNKILRDYNKVKEKVEELGADSNLEKKKDDCLVDDIFFNDSFPADAQVFSTEDDCIESFCIINRDLDYLMDSSLAYIKSQEDSYEILEDIDWSDWCEYTDYGLSKISVSDTIRKKAQDFKNRPKQAKVRAPQLKKRKKVSSYTGSSSRVRKKITNTLSKPELYLSWPIERSRFWISSLFGPRRKRSGAWGFHYGVDMASLKGTPVQAACTGIIVEARYAKGYGNTIVIAHSRKYRTRYAHLSKILVRVGQKVKRGVLIGRVGDTGYVRSSKGRDASHLHFELIEFGKKINPLSFVKS